MTGRRWALRPLILAGAMALITGAVFAQPTEVVRKATGERVTATLGTSRPTDQPAPTVAVDPSLGTVYTFHGSAHGATGSNAPATGAPSASSSNANAGANGTSPDGLVITFHGGRAGPDPTPTSTAGAASSPASNPSGTGNAPSAPNSGSATTPATPGAVITFHGGRAGPDPVPSASGTTAASAPTPSSTPGHGAAPTVGPIAAQPGPSRAPTALPPLPGSPKDLAVLAKARPMGNDLPPPGPTAPGAGTATAFGVVVSPSSPDGADDTVEDHWATLMQNEANRLSQESNVPLTVVVVRTRDEAMRRFIAQSVMHQDLTRYTEADSGLSALFSMGSRVNNSSSPTCYLLFRRDKIAALRDQFLAPMSAKVGEEATVAFLVGHETGHCLDYYERQRTFPTKGFWTSAETSKVGIAPAAAHRLFPNGMTPQAYTYASAALYGDLAQRQYEERLADAFGVMWAVHRGFPARLFDDVIDARKWIPRNDDHSTLPALVGLRTRYDDLQSKDFAHLWALARQVQQDVGVDASVGDGVSSEAAHFNGEEKFYGPRTTNQTAVDPTQGPEATVVGRNRVITRPFGQAYPAPAHPIEPPPMVVGRSKAPTPKPFGGSTFDNLKPFGSSTISGM